MAGYFKKPNRPHFTHDQTGQSCVIFFTNEAQRQEERPKKLAAHYMGHRLLVPPTNDEQARREHTEVYLFMPETGAHLTIRLSEVQTVWPARNDKRDAVRAAARTNPDGTTAPARRRGTSRPLDLSHAVTDLDLSTLDLSAYGR